ncbi:hypothetical protein PACTADRAFT_75001 [Pachysolen tannophilus NRRL Y-2460]|uniref:Mannosyltransferase n=1 Tax=Pachysolen tannophilus NRRL Y-2460 TaxID=669874 RepID=A0A1E4TVG5_PACTA|nr:hypothetical protein PACTADRAFT_75001 [Pachysolen tannophilus NRRL Y-2460]
MFFDAKNSVFNWRNIYILSVPARFFFALQPSYLHPDEHFQNFEVLTNSLLKYNTNVPWEFWEDSPARSVLPLLIHYGPVLGLIRFFKLDVDPIIIYYIHRFIFCFISWIVTDWCIYRIMPTKQERIKTIYFNSVNYISLCYQSHCFSNSVETWYLLLTLVIIENFRNTLEVFDKANNEHKKILISQNLKQSIYLGVLIAIGLLNRITFLSWLIFPSIFLLKFWFTISLKSFIITFSSFSLTILIGIATDIWWFNKDNIVYELIIPNLHEFYTSFNYLYLINILRKLVEFSIPDYTNQRASIIPIVNNFAYNLNKDNLIKHGLHSKFNHILTNIPLIFGPSLILIIFQKSYLRTTPFLSLISGLSFLSLIPHQELRFLMPLVPLGCACINLYISNKDKQENTNFFNLKANFIKWILKATIFFNLIMSILMGIFHQGGVIPTLEFLHNNKNNIISVYWRTYNPPSWLLGDETLKIYQNFSDLGENRSQKLYEFIDNISSSSIENNYLIDSMGIDSEAIIKSLQKLLVKGNTNDIIFVAPIASFNNHFKDNNHGLNFTQEFSSILHYDFDHFDEFEEYGYKVFIPGIGAWKVELL